MKRSSIAVVVVVLVLFGMLIAVVQYSRKRAEAERVRQEQIARERQAQLEREEQARREAEAEAKRNAQVEAAQKEQEAYNQNQPDPHPPVSVGQIEGKWWMDEITPLKAYGFVENIDVTRNLIQVTLPDKRTMAVSCMGSLHPTDKSVWRQADCVDLPFHSWIRVGMGDVLRSGTQSAASGWGLSYFNGGDRVERWKVEVFCDPYCKALKEKVLEELAADGERRKSGR